MYVFHFVNFEVFEQIIARCVTYLKYTVKPVNKAPIGATKKWSLWTGGLC